jgi:hypothetical protein
MAVKGQAHAVPVPGGTYRAGAFLCRVRSVVAPFSARILRLLIPSHLGMWMIRVLCRAMRLPPVEFGPEYRAGTDGQRLRLPRHLGTRDPRVWLGILVHERLHVAESDIGSLAGLTAAARRAANCLEDIRVDSSLLARHPLLKAVVYRPFILYSSRGHNPQDRYGSVLRAIVRRAYRVRVLIEEEWILRFFTHCGTRVDDIIARSSRGRTTDEVVSYALELDDIIQQYMVSSDAIMGPSRTAG